MNSCERARVPNDSDERNPGLFPSHEIHRPVSPQAFCQVIGLNWIAALELRERDLLSFNPKETPLLTRTQEAELRFLGQLIAAGCCGSVLTFLLSSLRRPYAYRLDRLYFDWINKEWRLLEDTAHIEDRFEEWLEELVMWGDMRVLDQLQEKVHEARDVLMKRQGIGRDPEMLVRSQGEGV